MVYLHFMSLSHVHFKFLFKICPLFRVGILNFLLLMLIKLNNRLENAMPILPKLLILITSVVVLFSIFKVQSCSCLNVYTYKDCFLIWMIILFTLLSVSCMIAHGHVDVKYAHYAPNFYPVDFNHTIGSTVRLLWDMEKARINSSRTFFEICLKFLGPHLFTKHC